MLCLGNICRSPYAEAVLAARLDRSSCDVRSAGFIKPGRPSPPEAIAIAADRGVDLRGHYSRTVPDHVASADLVIVMEPGQIVRARKSGVVGRSFLCLGDLDPRPIATRGIPDPFGRPAQTYSDSFDRIERCAAHLLAASGLAPGVG